ncbi:contact-dependent growth inhibition system immunity protein [Paraburkholderia ferrariae]|uniref:contact-dependent growth inhibition system immunity protein n=1 Tax=Paraburkholderia ferrariae TaxID=386056 RepID=UPI000A03CCD1|nr:contact-dependent growth inhibition system immunity protein [Paraburkholderia ferrariae]
MEQANEYPELSNFIQIYFGEDFALWGNTIEEILALYRSESDPASRSILRNEIDRFCRDNSRDLDASFEAAYGLFLDPTLWGHTTASFLDEIRRFLGE